LGRPCSFERLCQIIDAPELEALADLEVLLARQLLLETGDAGLSGAKPGKSMRRCCSGR